MSLTAGLCRHFSSRCGTRPLPAHTRRYHVRPQAARTIAALRDHVIAPILAGIRSPIMGRKPAAWTPIDRDHEWIRVDMQGLFDHLGITTGVASA